MTRRDGDWVTIDSAPHNGSVVPVKRVYAATDWMMTAQVLRIPEPTH